MKMNKFLFLGAISASLFFSSCSSDDDNIIDNGNEVETPESFPYKEGVII